MWRSLVAHLLWEQRRRFKSFHSDMEHIFFYIGFFLLLASNAMSILFIYKQFFLRNDYKNLIDRLTEENEKINKMMSDVVKETLKSQKKNIELSKSNKLLKEKIDSINNQFKTVKDYLTDN